MLKKVINEHKDNMLRKTISEPNLISFNTTECKMYPYSAFHFFFNMCDTIFEVTIRTYPRLDSVSTFHYITSFRLVTKLSITMKVSHSATSLYLLATGCISSLSDNGVVIVDAAGEVEVGYTGLIETIMAQTSLDT